MPGANQMVGSNSAIGVFAVAFIASALAGIAAYLRTNKPITVLAIITASLNSGLLGLAIALLWFQKFQENIYFLVGICVVTGLTGAAGLDFILTAIQKGGLSIKFDGTKDDKGNINMGFGMGENENTKDEAKK